MLRFALGLFFKVFFVVTDVAMQFAVGNLHNTVADGIEELSVVRNRQDRAGIALQLILKPTQCLKIQVISRFVEHEQIRFHDKQAGEMGPHDPAPT